MSEDVALISVGTNKDQAISSILRLYEKTGIKNFILAGTSSSTFPDKSELMGLADVNIKAVINNLSPSDMENNVKILQGKLGQYGVKVVDITGGTKALASSLTIYSAQRNIPIVYLEGSGIFSSYYPYVPRPLQSFKTYGKIIENKTPLRFSSTSEEFEMFDINKLAYYFNLITKEGDRVGISIVKGKCNINDNVDLSSDDKALQFTEEILKKIEPFELTEEVPDKKGTDKRSLDLDAVRRITGLVGYDINLKGKNFIFLDTNTFYNIPSEVLHTLREERIGFFVLDCVQAEIHYKCNEEKVSEACFAWSNFQRLNNDIVTVKNYENRPGVLRGKELKEKKEQMEVKNMCDTELALYFKELPEPIAASAVLLTFDRDLGESIRSKNVIVLDPKNTTRWKIRGIGFASFFRLLMILGKYCNVELGGTYGRLHIKTEKFKVKVSVTQK